MCVYNYISYIWLLRKSVLYIYMHGAGHHVYLYIYHWKMTSPIPVLERLRALIPVWFSSQETKTLQNPGGPERTRHTTMWKLCEFVLPEEPRCKENVGFWKNTMFLEKTQKLYPTPFPNKNQQTSDPRGWILIPFITNKSTQFHASFWFGVFGGNLSDRASRTAFFGNLVLDCQNRMSSEHFLK